MAQSRNAKFVIVNKESKKQITFGADFRNMKKLIIASGLILLIACDNQNVNRELPIVSEEIFEMEIGSQNVYGVRLKLSTEKPKEFLGIAVSLYLDEKVWIDTVLTELTKNDTVESEVIFSAAQVNNKKQPTIKTKTFAVQ